MTYGEEHHALCECEECEGRHRLRMHIPNSCLFDLDYNKGKNAINRTERVNS